MGRGVRPVWNHPPLRAYVGFMYMGIMQPACPGASSRMDHPARVQ
jgi:hypothetical protein